MLIGLSLILIYSDGQYLTLCVIALIYHGKCLKCWERSQPEQRNTWACGSPEQASTQLFHCGSQSRHNLLSLDAFSETGWQDLSCFAILLVVIGAGDGGTASGWRDHTSRWHHLVIGTADQPAFGNEVPYCTIFISFAWRTHDFPGDRLLVWCQGLW